MIKPHINTKGGVTKMIFSSKSLQNDWMCSPLHPTTSSKFVRNKIFVPSWSHNWRRRYVIQHSHYGVMKHNLKVSGCMEFIPNNDAKNVTSQIVLNDKIPNPQGTTQGAILGWPLLSP